MAGGAGSRLRPLTCSIPKPMTPIVNKPVMEYAVELLSRCGIKDICVTLQYLPQEIIRYFGDGSSFGVKLSYFVEKTPLGTAGSVKNAEDFLDEPFVVISGDALTDFDLSRAIEFHFDNEAMATIVLTTVENPLEFGVVISDEKGRIVKFLEKPGWGEVFSDRVNTGIYILDPEILKLIPPNTMFDFSKNLFPKLLELGKPLWGCVLEGYWCDIGNIQQYRQAHFDMLEGKVKHKLFETVIEKDFRMGKGTQIDPSAEINEPVLIGDDCWIGPGVRLGPYAVVGNNVIIEKDASVKRSVIWGNTYVGRGAALRGAVICKEVRINDGAAVYEGAVIGDSSHIGEYATINPDVKIWPYKFVERGAVVNSSIVWSSTGISSLFGRIGIPGIINLDITPEFAAKLGCAYGSFLNKNDEVIVSHDGKSATEMAKWAFISGLLASGINVYDGGELTAPINRYGVRALALKGGVHFKEGDRDQRINIQFFDHKGINIRRDAERKIENNFFLEDFRRAKDSSIGRILNAFHVTNVYFDSLEKKVNSNYLKSSPRIILSIGNFLIRKNLLLLLKKKGCKVKNTDDISDSVFTDRPKDQEKFLHRLSEIISKEKADFGAVISGDAEKLILIDSSGTVIADDMYTVLICLILFKTSERKKVVVPVNAPAVIERIAEKYNGEVIRTKTLLSAVMNGMMENDRVSAEGGYGQFFLQYDPVYALIKLLEFMGQYSLTLGDLLNEIPDYYMNFKSTYCPWEAKGTVMRKLVDQERKRKSSIELLDGIKIYTEDGWSFIFPDIEKPSYNVCSEAFSQETAESLTDFYLDKINEILQEEKSKN
ncbi:MAG: Nucleoside-diphosphate-sugar pyrophosphorylase family protein [Clostridia bacterium 41_269]|nr:MAG: Nucleoside-diphosphate-sugar pyrophosphorylase family protein [Clostridia bacterium 41_269]